MSREALSLDISQLVSRVVSGESIDTAERGAALAAKYPDLGMSGVLIGQAIERAAGMVGMIRNAPEPAKPFPRPIERTPAAAKSPAPTNGPTTNGATANGHHPPKPVRVSPALPVLPALGQSIDDELAAAIDAEIGNLVSGHTAKPAAPTQPAAPANPRSETRMRVTPPPAKVEARASTAWQANGETHAPVSTPAPAAAVPTASAEEPSTKEPQSSILSGFRRALFRS